MLNNNSMMVDDSMDVIAQFGNMMHQTSAKTIDMKSLANNPADCRMRLHPCMMTSTILVIQTSNGLVSQPKKHDNYKSTGAT
jgi:hypothetical protein